MLCFVVKKGVEFQRFLCCGTSKVDKKKKGTTNID